MTRDRSDRGAVLVQVAIAILVLTAMATFVVDHGVLLVSRGQAQNAADAGALSGAITRAYDELTDPPASNGKAFQSAMGTALANNIWTAAPSAQVSWASCLATDPTCPCPPGVACVRVNVYRNGEFGSTPLPTIFGKLLNISSQGVRATATARVASGNATNCMRPFAVADKWTHKVDPVLEFNHWVNGGQSGTELNPHDEYVPPSATDAGSGYKLPDDFGARATLKKGNPSSSTEPMTPGWFLPVQLPDGNGGYIGNGAGDLENAIANCIGNPVSIGQYLPIYEGNKSQNKIEDGVAALKARDMNAYWDSVNKQIISSCAPGCAPISPRIVPITVFDMDEYQWRRAGGGWAAPWGTYPNNPCPIGGKCVRVANILGFFVDGMVGSDVVGYLTSYPGEFVLDAPSVGGGAAFLKTIQLVR